MISQLQYISICVEFTWKIHALFDFVLFFLPGRRKRCKARSINVLNYIGRRKDGSRYGLLCCLINILKQNIINMRYIFIFFFKWIKSDHSVQANANDFESIKMHNFSEVTIFPELLSVFRTNRNSIKNVTHSYSWKQI